MDTMAVHGVTSDREQFEILIGEESRADEYRDDVFRLLEGKEFNAPVLYSADQIIDMIAQGRMQIWFIRVVGEERPCLFMLTELLNYPAGRTVNICLTAGSKLWPAARKFFPMFVVWCRKHQADYIECTTRPDIAAVLRRLGFAYTGVRMHLAVRRMQ